MHSVGIRTLKNRLSEYVRAAAAGDTVLVTDRGVVVAELIPPRVQPGASSASQIVADLARRGLLAPAKARPRAALPRRRPLAPLEDVLRGLDADRADR